MIKKGLSTLGILFLYLLSLLPFWLLYVIADGLFIILYYITGYRRKVVLETLRNSFPEKSEAELAAIEKKYYSYLADLIIETVKAISMSKKEIDKRAYLRNPELIDKYAARGKSIVAVTGHYGNWELCCLQFGFCTDKLIRLVTYKPLNNETFNNFFNKTRSRTGVEMISMRQTYRKLVSLKKELTFTILASDQTPTREEAQYFTSFLHQPTPVFLGIEKIAKSLNCVVVFFDMYRVGRGYYESTIVPLTEDPAHTEPFEITELHVRHLEELIREKPEYWLWSHRRWKIKPQDVH
jgi:KDO2-lipid IV(A) lauroyltransferase